MDGGGGFRFLNEMNPLGPSSARTDRHVKFVVNQIGTIRDRLDVFEQLRLEVLLDPFDIKPIWRRQDHPGVVGFDEGQSVQPRVMEEGVFNLTHAGTDLVPGGTKHQGHPVFDVCPRRPPGNSKLPATFTPRNGSARRFCGVSARFSELGIYAGTGARFCFKLTGAQAEMGIEL